MITLYYIPYLNRINEPQFMSDSDQYAFFEAHKVSELDNGFYPPYFRNEIVISLDDISYTGSYNYLKLSGSGLKDAYYFIDRIEYVSENAVKIYIMMDTIQTYYFNMTFNIHVTRESIDRWLTSTTVFGDNKINRGYIRENVSQGEFINSLYSKTRDDVAWLVVWLRSNKKICNGDHTVIPVNTAYAFKSSLGSSYTPKTNNAVITNAMPLCFPIYVGTKVSAESVLCYTSAGSGGYKCLSAPNIKGLVDDDDVLKVEYYPYNVFNATFKTSSTSGEGMILVPYQQSSRINDDGITETVSNTIGYAWYNTEGSTYVPIGAYYIPMPYTKPDSALVFGPNTAGGYSSKYVQFLYNTYKPNKNYKGLFDSSHVPALIDENFMHITFGEYLGSTTYPLSKLTTTMLFCITVYDFVSNSRTYYMSISSEAGLDDIGLADPYANIIINNTTETIELYNNAWKQYYSRNQATWTTGYTLAQSKNTWNFVKGAFSDFGNLVNNVVKEDVGGGARTIMSGITNVGQYFQSEYELEQERAILKENLEGTPDTLKQGNNYSNDMLLGNLDTVLKVDLVNDFEYVAQYFERNGYKVNKYYDECSMTDSRFRNRTMFNYIAGEIYDITFNNLVPADIINDIKARFKIGLRLWHEDRDTKGEYNIGNYTYDNMERNFL